MNSILGKAFGFNPLNHKLSKEITAGITTFLTMSYILAVNPNIFEPLAESGMDSGAVFTATAIASAVGTLLMALLAKMPLALAPGMGLNAFLYIPYASLWGVRGASHSRLCLLKVFCSSFSR